MTIRQFVPVAVAVVGGLAYGAQQVGVPAPPVAVIATVASVMLALQLEDHKLGDLLSDLMDALRATSKRAG